MRGRQNGIYMAEVAVTLDETFAALERVKMLPPLRGFLLKL